MKIIGKPELHAQLLLCRAVGAGGHGLPDLTNQFNTLSQLGREQIMPTLLLVPPLGFSDLPTALLCVYCLCS